jgi:class 3 adenylate cyclase/pimeloyl-ACP methyl ester carboxylesterase
MNEANEDRRILAIMFTDVVGYTALTERDEAAAVRVRDRHRQLVETLVKQFDGEVVDTTGDESLSIFPSALRAVDCALAIQGALRSHPDLRLRIGIHLGDVLRRGSEVIGEGVNVASRIRPLSEPGGVCVSEPVYQMVRSRAHVSARALGAQSLKSVASPVAVYALTASDSTAATPPARRSRRWLAAAVVGAALLGAVALATMNAGVQAWAMLQLPKILTRPIEQQIAFAETPDGVRIAYATTGSGPPLVFVLGWGTHLTEGLGSPLYDGSGGLGWHSREHLVVRYDGRGFGLSDRNVTDFSLEARVRDLETVVDALGLERFALYAYSAGGPTGIAFAESHPERVSQLVLAATNAGVGSLPAGERPMTPEMADGLTTLMRTSWDSSMTRATLAEFLAPEASEVQRRIVMHFLEVSCNGPDVAAFFAALGTTDASAQASRVRVPTLVVAGDADSTIPVSGSRRLASLIPGARFEILEGAGHIAASVTDPRLMRMVSDFLKAAP